MGKEAQQQQQQNFIDRTWSKIPDVLKPSQKTGVIFALTFFFALGISFLNIPLSEILGGNINTSIEIGTPYAFLVFSLMNPSSNPLVFSALIYDMLIYFAISYLASIAINLLLKIRIFPRKETSSSPASK